MGWEIATKAPPGSCDELGSEEAEDITKMAGGCSGGPRLPRRWYTWFDQSFGLLLNCDLGILEDNRQGQVAPDEHPLHHLKAVHLDFLWVNLSGLRSALGQLRHRYAERYQGRELGQDGTQGWNLCLNVLSWEIMLDHQDVCSVSGEALHGFL